ncbi:hypothetical protein Anapl_14106 [Anas platyrhynchos]|uniref:Uncharacterized protein n=1 Tax=Anas platyrhynchos TaxID=8839 RepID=R0L0A6_ANAPL|nr:hypothetical protein Anapl_14106 [Anas platyrhynchos]
MVDINKEGGDLGMWQWGSESLVVGDNIKLFNDEVIRNVKSLEEIKKANCSEKLVQKVTGNGRTGAEKKLKLREADPCTQPPPAGKQLRIMGNHKSLETKTVLVTLQLILLINNQTVYEPETWDQIEVKRRWQCQLLSCPLTALHTSPPCCSVAMQLCCTSHALAIGLPADVPIPVCQMGLGKATGASGREGSGDL